jgi:hypothetical protein
LSNVWWSLTAICLLLMPFTYEIIFHPRPWLSLVSLVLG